MSPATQAMGSKSTSDSASMLSNSTTSTLTSLKSLLHKRGETSKPKPRSKPSPEQLAKEKQIRGEARAAYFSLR